MGDGGNLIYLADNDKGGRGRREKGEGRRGWLGNVPSYSYEYEDGGWRQVKGERDLASLIFCSSLEITHRVMSLHILLWIREGS